MPDAALLNSKKTGAVPIDLFSTNYRLLLEGSQNLFPVPTYTETFASGPGSEGGILVRSRPDNIVGSGQILIRDTTRALLLDKLATFEQRIEECRAYGGELIYTPEGGVTVTYDIESARIVSMDRSTGRLQNGNVPATFELTCLPYGRLAPVSVVSDAASTDIMLSFNVPPFAGSVDALGELAILNGIATARYWFEGGLESRYYDPATVWPLVVDSALLTPLDSPAAVTNTTLASEYGASTLRQTLTTATKKEWGIGFYQSSWVGRFRIKARVWSTALDTALQVRYSARGGSATSGAWKPIPAANVWQDIDCGLAAFPPPLSGSTHSARLDFYAKALSGSPTVDLDAVKLVPAERYWRANGSVGATATLPASGWLRLTHQALETQTSTGVYTTHPNAIGSYLLIPPKGGRIAVFAARADLATTASYANVADNLRAWLTVTPRVALLGA